MSTQDPMTEALGRELHRRVDGLYDAPLTLDDVRGRARSIRRRRTGIAAGVAAAAVAAALVVPAALSGSLDRADGPEPAPPAPARSAHTAVLHDGRVTMPDGATVPVALDNADVTQLGVLTDGRILAATSRPQAIQVLSPEGSPEATYRVTYNALTMSSDDHLAAWVDEQGRVQVLESGSAEPVALAPVPMPGEAVPTIDAVTGSDCAHGGCRVLAGDGTSTFAATTSDRAEELPRSDLRVSDVSPDGALWAVGTIPDESHQFGCAGLYDPRADRLVAKSCRTSNLRFAPDGRHLLGWRGDNNMFSDVTVLDDRLSVVGGYTPKGEVVSRAAWADDGHLLAATVDLEDNQWSLVRVSLDGGQPEVVAGPVAGRNPDMIAEFQLSD